MPAQYKRIAWGAAPAATPSNSHFDPMIGDSSGALRSAIVNPPVPSPQLQQSQPSPYQDQSLLPSSSRLTGPLPTPLSSGINNNRTRGKLDISSEHKQIRSKLLSEAIFPDWRDDASGADLDDPDEMQKNDPVTISQLWKQLSKTKKRVPHQERMENLSWRMMGITLKQQRDQARYDSPSLILSALAATMRDVD